MLTIKKCKRFQSTARLVALGFLLAAQLASAQGFPRFSIPGSSLLEPADPDSELTAYERFGLSVAVGDFNDDGFDDVAVGDPFADVGFVSRAGLVDVFHGSADGLRGPRSLQLSAEMNLPAPCRFLASHDRFGAALATGDFDNDGFEDLAVGIPLREVPLGDQVRQDAGAVQIFRGAIDDLDGTPNFEIGPCLTRGDAIVGGEPGGGDEFGAALAAGEFENIQSVATDLAIGAPGTTLDGEEMAGSVDVLYGDNTGAFGAPEPSRFNIGSFNNLPLDPRAQDRFGSSLVSGDLLSSSSRRCDLVIGIPNRDILEFDTGSAIAARGCTGAGVSTSNPRYLSLLNLPPGTPVTPRAHGATSLAVGDFDCDGIHDVALGVPDAGVDGAASAGAVWIFYQQDSQTPSQIVDTGDLGIPTLGATSRFGASLLALGSEDGCDDLIVGAPGEVFENSGVVVLKGSAVGLQTTGFQFLDADQPGAPGPHSFNSDGTSLAVGRIDGVRRYLMTGRPLQENADHELAGALWMIPEERCGLFCDGFESGDLSAW